jgi:hypothetical protein
MCKLMKGAEADFGTGLDWVAVDQRNTDNPISTCSSVAAPTTGESWPSAGGT